MVPVAGTIYGDMMGVLMVAGFSVEGGIILGQIIVVAGMIVVVVVELVLCIKMLLLGFVSKVVVVVFVVVLVVVFVGVSVVSTGGSTKVGVPNSKLEDIAGDQNEVVGKPKFDVLIELVGKPNEVSVAEELGHDVVVVAVVVVEVVQLAGVVVVVVVALRVDPKVAREDVGTGFKLITGVIKVLAAVDMAAVAADEASLTAAIVLLTTPLTVSTVALVTLFTTCPTVPVVWFPTVFCFSLLIKALTSITLLVMELLIIYEALMTLGSSKVMFSISFSYLARSVMLVRLGNQVYVWRFLIVFAMHWVASGLSMKLVKQLLHFVEQIESQSSQFCTLHTGRHIPFFIWQCGWQAVVSPHCNSPGPQLTHFPSTGLSLSPSLQPAQALVRSLHLEQVVKHSRH